MRLIRFFALALLLATTSARSAAAATTFVSTGSTWKYLDDGTDPGSAWIAPGFDESSWASGPAQLGYGDGDEATVVSFGPDSNAKYPATYFRQTFNVSGAAGYGVVTLRLVRDDGAVVYLNGSEVYRSNMPAGAVNYLTLASAAVSGAAESQFFSTTLSPSVLLEGDNTIAVEVHQSSGSSSDVSFDLELIGSNGSITRGPYLQAGTPTSVVVRWRTDIANNSRVRFGSDPMNLPQIADDATSTTEHVVTLSGLSADTRYYYSVGTTTEVLAGGDADHTFVTAPVAGTAKKTRVWVLGDSGTADANASAVRNGFNTFAGSSIEDLWLMLGDNAYNSGTDGEYQAAVFDMYPAQLRRSVLWPTLGNHDAASADSSTQSGVYYDIFSLPTAAQAGGVASGTEAYYSFDYGNIHFVCLDSMESDRTPGGAMLTWLEDDLLAATADWVIAFWHHPPYTKGSHNSDTESELIDMRQNVLPILDDLGVDLVLTGHSHSYERSILLDAHYGVSTTLAGSMILDGGDGRLDGDGAYHKATLGSAAHEGAVYVVAGSSGQTSAASLNHPAMYVSLLTLGSLVLDVNHNVLRATFLGTSGTVQDYFTMTKGAPYCGNELIEVGESCDSTDLAGATCAAQGCSGGTPTCSVACTIDYGGCTGCGGPTATPTATATATPTPSPTATNTPTPVSRHDAVILAVDPVALVITAGQNEVSRDVRFKVFNANLLPAKDPVARPLQVSIDSNTCPPSMIGRGVDFDLRAVGEQDTATLSGGKSKKGRFQLHALSSDFTSLNATTSTRCTLLLNVAVASAGNDDPTPLNNQVPVEVSIVDQNDTANPATHESSVSSLRPVRIKLGATTASVTKRLSVRLRNGDTSPSAEAPGHKLYAALNTGDSTCPSGMVTVSGTSSTVAGGDEISAEVTITAAPTSGTSANRRSPARCIAVLQAVTDEPGNVEPDTSNNETRLVVDLDDRHDY